LLQPNDLRQPRRLAALAGRTGSTLLRFDNNFRSVGKSLNLPGE
jgi:hypothetical protein